MSDRKSAQSNKADTNDIDEKIMTILNAHTFKDQTAYSPGLVDDLLAALQNLIAQETNKALDDIYKAIPITFKGNPNYQERTAEEWREEVAKLAAYVQDYEALTAEKDQA